MGKRKAKQHAAARQLFAENLARLIEAHYSGNRSRAATELEINYQVLLRILRGSYNLKLDWLQSIADHFGVTPAEMLSAANAGEAKPRVVPIGAGEQITVVSR